MFLQRLVYFVFIIRLLLFIQIVVKIHYAEYTLHIRRKYLETARWLKNESYIHLKGLQWHCLTDGSFFVHNHCAQLLIPPIQLHHISYFLAFRFKNQIKYLVLNLAVGRGVFFFDLIREWKQKVAMPFLAVYILDDVGSFLQSFGWHWFNSDGLVLVYWVGSTR